MKHKESKAEHDRTKPKLVEQVALARARAARVRLM
jgi:hypothetical protein